VHDSIGLNLLYVEDNRDLREAVSAALADQGYAVDVAECAGEGLLRMGERRFHLVISDYALPDQTGAWMLREAAARGLLDRTETLIVTANPHPEDTGGIPVLQKPLDLGRLLLWIERLLLPERAVARP
jgi:two-component system response regulator GlrR